MRVFLAIQPYGILLLDENGKLLELVPFPRDVGAIASILERRVFVREAVSKILSGVDADEIVVNDSILKEVLDGMGRASVLSPSEKPFSAIRSSPLKYASQAWGEIKQKEYFQILNELGILLSKSGVRERLSSLDQQVIKAIDFVDHSNKALNIIAPTIREWYSIHFPELDELIEDHYDFMKLISIEPDRRKLNQRVLEEAGFDEKTIKKIIKASRDSIGADLSDTDLQAIRRAALSWLELYEAKREMELYIEDLMKRAAPNLSAVVHPMVGARLIAIAGSLERLASLPASSIQILGAHKAIFMHLTKGTKPPKHGVIFQAKEVRGAPRSLRGKISRLLATKIAIAARVDVYGNGKYIGDRLRMEIEEKIKKLLEAVKSESKGG
ncbi:MAG: hypothetical protein LM591_02110 [Candidatus Korarchaeum sp.]|nr:hypothetical protein [Candidatus Korarchaeum sp.]